MPEFVIVSVCVWLPCGVTEPNVSALGDTLTIGCGGGGVKSTVNAPLNVAFCPPGFVMITSLGPTPAMIVMLKLLTI